MFFSHYLRKYSALKLELLLPLPLLLLAFGLSGESLTNKLLSRSYSTQDKLQADTQTVKIQPVINALLTAVEIEPEPEYTQIELNTANSVVKKLVFKVPATELSKVKALVAQELGLSGEVETLQVNTKIQANPGVKVIGILAEINPQKGVTKVEIKTANSLLKTLEIELPITQLSQVKTMIRQELGLSCENARKLVSYRVKN